MKPPFALRFSLLCLALVAAPATLASYPAEYDDCDAGFIAFAGSNTYQFSPSHVGDLGRVRLLAIVVDR